MKPEGSPVLSPPNMAWPEFLVEFFHHPIWDGGNTTYVLENPPI
jgi:hypothetical protein